MKKLFLTFAAMAITAGAWAGKSPVAKAVPDGYIDVTPTYYKFYNGVTDLNTMLRSDLQSPGNPSLGNQSFITSNYGSTADKYFNSTNLSQGNVMFGGPFGRVNQEIVKNGMSLYDMGEEIGTVLVLNGKNSNLAEALKEFQGLDTAPEIPKLESFTGNIQLFWILDYLNMNQKVPTGSNILVRLVINGYNNDMSSTKEVINYLDKVDESGNENMQNKKVNVTFDEFADTDNTWNPNLWMVYDVEMPYNRLASYFRTLLSQGTSGLDDGALLIRSIEIYGLPNGYSSGLTPELVYKSWKDFSGEEELPEEPGENEDPENPGQDDEYTGTYDSERVVGGVNHALQLEAEGYVDCGLMPALNNLSSYSVQFWMKPKTWTEGASLLSRGDKFIIDLGKEGNVDFYINGSTLTVASENLKAGKWAQITLINNNGTATALVNGKVVAEGKLPAIAEEAAEFMMGGGFNGLLDDVRLWDAALNDEMKSFDYFTNNTINKWCPMWDNLIVYYKMDQVDCPYVEEYKATENPNVEFDNHGIVSENGVSKVDANNDKLPYLVNAAYTENIRFFDRIIPVDQYLLSNEIIILGAECVGATGHIVLRTPNNHAISENGEYLSTYEGRNGILSLDGKDGTRLVAPAATWNSDDKYGFETWIYLEEWTPGAYIFRKETADGTQGISLRLGDDAEAPVLITRINGNEFVSQAFNLPVGQWAHIGMAPGSGGSVIKAVMFFLNDTSIRPNVSLSTTSYDVVPQGNEDLPIYIGEGLNAKFDETAFWKKAITIEECKKDMTSMPMPSLTKNANVIEMDGSSAYYKFDKSEDLGYSSHSQDEWANIMRSAYDGYTPAKFTISVRGHDAASASDNFTSIINNANKRKIFAQDLAEISKNYDGVELDLEWIYTWDNYSLLADEIVAALPEGKTFRISTHNVSYNYPKNKIDNPGITGFTFQQYGPQRVHFNYVNGFTNYVQYFLNYGYPADKIMTSYSTTTSNGEKGADILGVRNGILAQYTPSDANIDSYTSGGETWYYMGPMQVYKRAKYTRELNLQGIFYWDMGNDYWEGTAANPVMPKYNSAKYCSYGLNSNIDRIADANLVVNHIGTSGIEGILDVEDVTKGIFVSPSPAEEIITVSLSSNEIPAEVKIYSVSGQLVLEGYGETTFNVGSFTSGIYMLTATSGNGKRYQTKFIKR